MKTSRCLVLGLMGMAKEDTIYSYFAVFHSPFVHTCCVYLRVKGMDGADEGSIAALSIVQHVSRRKNRCLYHASSIRYSFSIMDSLGGVRLTAYFFSLV
jgi:hypothetical protein